MTCSASPAASRATRALAFPTDHFASKPCCCCCTLPIGNTLVNVMLAILTDPIWVLMFGDGTLGFIFDLMVPTTLIVIASARLSRRPTCTSL